MNKKLAVAVLVALLPAAYVGASWHFGKKAETGLRAEIAKLNAELGKDYVQVRDYQRGLFDSKATITIRPDPSAQEAAYIVHEVKHGPVAGGRLAAVSTRTRFDRIESAPAGADAPETRAMIDVLKSMTLSTRVGFNQSVDGNFDMPPGSFANSNLSANWQHARLDFSTKGGREDVEMNGLWPGMKIEGKGRDGAPAGTLQIGQVSIVGNQKLAKSLQMMSAQPGESTMKVASFLFELPPLEKTADVGVLPKRIGMSNLELRSDQKLTANQLMAGTTTMSVASLEAADMKIERLNLKATVDNIDTEVMARLVETLQAIGKQGDGAAPSDAQMKTLMDDGLKLLRRKPGYAVDSGFSLNGKDGSFHLDVRLDELPADTQADIPSLMAQLPPAINATIRADLPRAWATSLAGIAAARSTASQEELGQQADDEEAAAQAADAALAAAQAAQSAGARKGRRALATPPPPSAKRRPVPAVAAAPTPQQIEAQVDQGIQQAVEAGWVKQNGDRLQSEVTLRKSMLTLNGNPLGNVMELLGVR